MALTTTTRNRITETIGARPSDCTPAMWDILGVLRGCTGARTVTGHWSYAEIAGLANCSLSTARKAVRELTERGYIAVYDTAHANRYRLSVGDREAAERNLDRLEARNSTPAKTNPAPAPMAGIADAANRIAFPGRPMHGRRTTIHPRRTGTRLVTEHDTPRGRVFRLVPVRAQQSARALQAMLADDRGEIRVGALLGDRKGNEDRYAPKHLTTDDRPRWQRLIAPVGLGVVIAASLTVLGVTAANTAAAEATVPTAPDVLYPTWKTTNPGIDEPTENRSRTTNDDMRGNVPTPDGEAEPLTPTAEREKYSLTDGTDGTAMDATTASAETLPNVVTQNTPPSETPPSDVTTTVTDVNGTVWEIAADGTVLGVLQGGTAGGSVAYPAPEPTEPTEPTEPRECTDGWTVREDENGPTALNPDGQECVPPSNQGGEASQTPEQGETVPEYREDDSEPL